MKSSDNLEQGWIFDMKVDNGDAQYAGFRKHLPTLVVVLIFQQMISRLIIMFFGLGNVWGYIKRHTVKLLTSLLFSVVFITALFGASALKIMLIVSIHYVVVKRLPKVPSVLFSWGFSIAILFLNNKYSGYQFGDLSPHLAFLDNYRGVGLRWYITFNFNVLRMISFSMDKGWASSKGTIGFDDVSTLDSRQRLQISHSLKDYSYINYLSYVLYAPLFLAGPIICFNDFMHQMRASPSSISWKGTTKYFFRWIAAVLIMEIMMHTLYVVSIKNSKGWIYLKPMETYTLGFFNLKMIWLKLMIIWRFFRLWAMCDGVETVENMGRCMSNHYSGVEFWKHWHSSYNRWLVRYMYVPLGGNRWKSINSFAIFTFVAYWHDPEGRLLTWGWIIAFFLLPEIACVRLFCSVSV
jgi:protein-cysteine N-palmitoyltransferase HHAT